MPGASQYADAKIPGESMIHPQLLEDCHLLGRMSSGMLLLHRNAVIPWFILVPETELEDVLDLPPAALASVTTDCALVSAFIKKELGCGKVNFAGLGNVVPQMHLHIIGRTDSDPCWPKPVWGNLAAGPAYAGDTLSEWRRLLVAGYELSEN
jgi:diadenosine tetraphosphate (Ap4A) HIT family hydrolase